MPLEENSPDVRPASSDAPAPGGASAEAIAMPAAPEQDDRLPSSGTEEGKAGEFASSPSIPALSGPEATSQKESPTRANDAAASPATIPAPDGSVSSAPSSLPEELPSRYREAKEAAARAAGPSATSRPSANPAASGKGQRAKARRTPPAVLVEPGPAARLFRALSYAGLPVLLALMALMTLQELFAVRTLWFSDEVRHADVYMRLLGGDWLALNLNGVPYPDKPPVYFWLLELLDRLPGVDQPMLFFLGTALSAVLFAGVTWLLARATGHDRRVAFAAGLMTVGCLFVAGLAHYPRMDLLFSVVITLSMICLYRGWIKTSAPVWLTLGFVLAGVATLIKGPLGIAFPVLSSILFLFWRGTPGRLNGRDGLFGFALMLIMLLVWVGALYFDGEVDYLKNIFGPQIAGRMVNAWHHAAPWWYYLAALPLVWLPWTFLALFVNWWRAARNLPGAWKNRREDGGRGWLWLSLIGGVALLSAVSGKIAIYLLPLMPCLAVLSARALLNLSPRRSRWFYLCLGVFFALLGLAFIAAQYSPLFLPLLPEAWTTALPPVARAYLDSISGLALMGLVLLILAVVLLFFTRRSLPEGGLLLTAVGIILLMQPYARVVAPSLDTMLSPRAQSEEMARYTRQGFYPAAYRVYPGIYAYYLNAELARSADDAAAPAARPAVAVQDIETMDGLLAMLATHPRAVIAMREKDWNRWTDKPADLQLVQRQWIVDQPYVLALRDAPDMVPGAPDATDTLDAANPEDAAEGMEELNASGKAEASNTPDEPGAPGTVPSPDAAAPETGSTLTPAASAKPVMPAPVPNQPERLDAAESAGAAGAPADADLAVPVPAEDGTSTL